MAILNFQKPNKVIMIESSDHEGRFEFRPLEPGYGLTVGNALRRVLLSSLEGFAITSVKIEGVDHEFSTIPGIVEDVTEIVLNLKQIRFKRQIEDIDNELVSISISGQDKITAGDFQKFISGFQILNSDQVICNLDPKVQIQMEITIDKGRGYVTSEENKNASAQLGTIFLEADEIAKTETYDEESLHMRQLLKTKLIDMDLSVRALNCLKAAEVDTLGDLVSFNKNDLMKFRNFGKKSLTELEELVMLKGLSFGMDLSKYKLEKD